MTALVLEERAPSSRAGSMLQAGRETSTNTGTAPYWTMGATVVGKPAATVMTSSPRRMRRSPRRGEVKAENASKLAEEPAFTREQYGTPK